MINDTTNLIYNEPVIEELDFNIHNEHLLSLKPERNGQLNDRSGTLIVRPGMWRGNEVYKTCSVCRWKGFTHKKQTICPGDQCYSVRLKSWEEEMEIFEDFKQAFSNPDTLHMSDEPIVESPIYSD